MQPFKSLLISSTLTPWLLLILSSLCFEAIALYYQYVLGFQPCVVCIQVRILLVVCLLVSLAGLCWRQHAAARIAALLTLLISYIALIERSWELLGTERGFIMGSCSFDLGLPNWLAVDQWLPFLFKVQTTCGYTPEIAFGFSMAEVLLALFVLFAAFILCLLLLDIKTAAHSLGKE